MRAIILAAGRGNRMKPLTDNCPKPLVPVNGKPLIVYHLERLKVAGITDIVINLHHLGAQIEDYLGNGQHWGLNIVYSRETELLEVGGGILNALPLLGPAPFIVVNGDIWTDFPFTDLPSRIKGFAHLVLVENPMHNQKGDFAVDTSGLLSQADEQQRYTYSGLSVLSPNLFDGCQERVFRLAPLLVKAMQQHLLTGEIYNGFWTDVGTVERLQQLEHYLSLQQQSKMA